MTSYSSLLAYAMMLAIVLQILGFYQYGQLDEINRIYGLLNERINYELRSSGYRVDVLEDTVNVDSKDVYFWVRNTGLNPIPISEADYFDVILIYFRKRGGSLLVVWVSRWTRNPKSFQWAIEGANEYTNSMYPSPNSGIEPISGLWDPGEELYIHIRVPAGYDIDTKKPIAVLFGIHTGAYDMVVR